MKRLKQFCLVLIIGAIAITIDGCKKGKDGEPGKDGSSNVTSYTYSIPSWTNGPSFWYTDLNVPELTSSNINTASVQVYFGTVSNTWTAMPFTQYATINYWMNFVTTIGNIDVQWWYNGAGTGSSPVSYYSGLTSQFKVVIIPPSMMVANPDVNWKNYEEVKSRFNLKE